MNYELFREDVASKITNAFDDKMIDTFIEILDAVSTNYDIKRRIIFRQSRQRDHSESV